MSDNGDAGLDDVLAEMNGESVLEKRPSDDLPSPEVVEELNDADQKVIDRLPDVAGFYWVEEDATGEITVARIDKKKRRGVLVHWGHSMNAEDGYVSVIDRWMNNFTIMEIIERKADPLSYDTNTSFGAF